MEVLQNWDAQLFQFINSGLSSDILDFILVPLRHKLFWIPLYLFLISFIVLNFSKSRWILFLSIGLCIGCSDYISSKVIKPKVHRVRPCHKPELNVVARIPCSHGYSFTSSHATNHFAISTLLFMSFGFWKWRGLFLGWAALISLAQVYVGVHYPLDVLAGGALGCVIGMLSFYLYKYLFNHIIQTHSDGVHTA